MNFQCFKHWKLKLENFSLILLFLVSYQLLLQGRKWGEDKTWEFDLFEFIFIDLGYPPDRSTDRRHQYSPYFKLIFPNFWKIPGRC